MPALPGHTKQICRTPNGGCMCDPEYSDCDKLSRTTCDCCNKVIPSDIAQMDPDNREVLCPECYAWEYPHLDRLRKYREAPASAPAPVPQYERGD